MINQTRLTPGRKYLTGTNAKAFENNIIDSSNKKALQQSIVWGALNFCLLSIVLYDIINTCPVYVTYLQYIEYFGAIVLFLNIIYHAATYIRIQISLNKPKCECIDPVSLSSTPIKPIHLPEVATPPTPMNLSAASWMSNLSTNESRNVSIKSSSWTFSRGSPKPNGVSPTKAPRPNTSDVDFISDESALTTYLRDFEAHEKVSNLSKIDEPSTNILNSFWTHPTAKSSKDVSSYLKRCHYQLSTPAANVYAIVGDSPKTMQFLFRHGVVPCHTKCIEWDANHRACSYEGVHSATTIIALARYVCSWWKTTNFTMFFWKSGAFADEMVLNFSVHVNGNHYQTFNAVESPLQLLISKSLQNRLSSIFPSPSTHLIGGAPSTPNIHRTCRHPTVPNYYYGSIPTLSSIGKFISLAKPLSAASILIASTSNSPKNDDKVSPRGSPVQGMDTWRRLHVDPIVLTQWNANLRIWLSQTILNRLVKEFNIVDEALQKHGFGDVQIGKVGLERLRRTAQTIPVLQFIQTLPTMIPFLELTPNQEYLVKRIKELANGGCMSDFKWNSGSSINGKEWDNNLPTDSAIVMHLFASYMDTQLQPLPNNPDLKAFSGYHYIKLNEKPTLNASSLAIQQCSDYPPYYKVIVGEEVFEVVKGYNNLFHTILLFLYYVNKREHGMLGQVNLGRSGVNLLWVIQS